MKKIIFKQYSEYVEEGDIVFKTENKCWSLVVPKTDEYILVGGTVGDAISCGLICAVAREMECEHDNTKYQDWPDGGAVEICQDCGMSRHLSEMWESDWVIIDIEKEKKLLEQRINDL